MIHSAAERNKSSTAIR